MFSESLDNEEENNSNSSANITQTSQKKKAKVYVTSITNGWKYNWTREVNDQNRAY